MCKSYIPYLQHILAECRLHDYMGVNYLIVWDVVKNLIPELSIQIEEVIKA